MNQQLQYVHHEKQAEINRAHVFDVLDSVVSETLNELNPRPTNRIESISSQLASYQAAVSQMKRIAVIKQKSKPKTETKSLFKKHVENRPTKIQLAYYNRLKSVDRMYKRGDIDRVEVERLYQIWSSLYKQEDSVVLPFGRRLYKATW